MQYPNQSNIQNVNNVRRDASRHIKNKNKAYLKVKIEELETNSKIKNVRDLYRSISDFKKGYQPRTSTVRDEKDDLVTESHSSLARWRNYFSQLLNVQHGVNEGRQAEIHTVEPLVPEPSAFEVELAIEKLNSYKLPDTDQLPTEIIKAGGRTICGYRLLIVSIWDKEELPEEWKESIIVPIYKKGDKTDCSNYRATSLLPTTYTILFNILAVEVNSICRGNCGG
jgi:hypothetical protein